MGLIEDIKMKLSLAKKAWNASDKGLTDAVNIVLSLVVIGVAGAIGLFIMDRVSTTTGTPTNAAIRNASNSTFSTVDTGFSFVVILVIAFIGTIALGYIYGMLPNQRREM